jgi:hypothetical protein
MKAVSFSETSVPIHETERCHIPDDYVLHNLPPDSLSVQPVSESIFKAGIFRILRSSNGYIAEFGGKQKALQSSVNSFYL